MKSDPLAGHAKTIGSAKKDNGSHSDPRSFKPEPIGSAAGINANHQNRKKLSGRRGGNWDSAREEETDTVKEAWIWVGKRASKSHSAGPIVFPIFARA